MRTWARRRACASLGVVVATTLFCAGELNAAQPRKNLIENSSFELLDEEGAPVGWNARSNEGVISVDTAVAHDGKIGIHFVLDGKETVLGQRSYFKLQPGKPYTFSAYVKTKNLEPAGSFQLQLINLGWSFGYQSRLPIDTATSDWKRYSRTFTCPPADAFKYQGMDNMEYMAMMYAKGVRGEVCVDAIQLEESTTATEYEPLERRKSESGDPIFDALVADLKRTGFRRVKYWKVEKPMFRELLSNEPGPDCVLYYGYEDILSEEVYRPYAKKFGHRYVLDEQVQGIRSRPFIPMTNAWARGGVGSYPTMRMILRPDVKDAAPLAFGDRPWIMHPKWQEAYVKAAIRLAEQSLDQKPENTWGNTWGLWAGDEVFESSGIKVVPRDKRDDAINAIDREVREKFGFGKYGMPDSEDDTDPFKRIAFRRWVNAKLTETFKKTYALVKKINPKLLMLGPDPCGAVPPVDLEAMTPYFDLVSNQSWYSPSSFTQQLATGADTKAMVDLSECPVWALVQHAAANDPEALREQYSQAFRNGGEGLIILGVGWYDRELEHPQYTNPPQWRALLEIADTVTKMNKVTLPKPDTAILYASDTFLTLDNVKMAGAEHPQTYAAYAALGPCVGSWFSFVSDRQIDRGTRNLSDYKLLYIPFATYVRGAVLDKIEEYIKGGGIVVCADPTAFTWDINGEDLSSKWAGITGVKKGKAREGTTSARTVSSGFLRGKAEIRLVLPAPGVVLSPTDESVQPLAVFADGAPAATIRAYGKGRVMLFAANPFDSVDKRTPIIELMKNIQLAAGARIGLDIWRFKLPPFKTVYVADTEKHSCLTNNNLVLDVKDVKMVHNLSTNGTYTYDRFPTGIADAASSGEIPFGKGHLTNRRQAYEARHVGGSRNPPELEKWIVSWTDKGAVALTIDLKKPYALNRLTLFYSGILPELRIQGGTDGKTWSPLATHPVQPAGHDVLDATIALKGRYRHIRVNFAARTDNAPMELAEMEVWGDR